MTTLLRFFAPILALLLFLCGKQPTFAQFDIEEGEIVRSIAVEFVGPATISRERVLANIRTSVGSPFSQPVVEQDIRNLYATGEVANVRIVGDMVENGVAVTVVIQSSTTVKDVKIEGATRISERRLRRDLTVEPNKTLREEALEVDRQKILELYSEKGFTDVEVTYRVDAGADANTSSVTYFISEGDKRTVRSVAFEGNTVLSDKDLRKVTKMRPRSIFSIFTKTGRIDDEKMDADMQAIREAYQAKGFVDAEVVDVRQDPAKGGDIALVYVIEEGSPYTIGTVSFQGFRLISTEQVATLFGSRTGDVFAPKTIDAGIKAIESHYGSLGYVDLSIGRRVTPGAAGALNILLEADEGGPSYVERVVVTGNTKTKDKVIRRELTVAPGDLYNTLLVENSRRRIQGLGLFEKVETYPTDTGVEGTKDVNVNVEEKRTGNLSFGAGFSSIDNLVGFAEVSQGNFDIGNWRTFSGAGQKLRLRGVLGVERQDGLISFVEPWFLDQQLSLGVDLFYREAQFVSDVYDQRTAGAAVSLRKPLGEFTSVKLEYRIEDITMQDLNSDASEAFVRSAAEDGLQTTVSLGLAFDKRDSATLTRRGFKIELNSYLMASALGGNQDIYGLSGEISKYFLLPGDTIFLINGEIATIDTWGDSSFIPVYNRLYLGGANTLRGFKFRDVGPKDAKGEPVGGNSLARLTLEYTFPIISRVRGALFYDMGMVSSDSFDLGSDFNSNVGFGARLDLPIGPIRIDLGFPLQTDDFNDDDVRFNFTVGWQF